MTICQASDKHRQVVKENLSRDCETISSGSCVSGRTSIRYF